MKCSSCGKSGEIGKSILFKADGMIPHTTMKKYRALCSVCAVKSNEHQKS